MNRRDFAHSLSAVLSSSALTQRITVQSHPAGYAVAQNNLALMYANGTGTEHDYCLAYAWLSLASRALPASQKLLEQVESRTTSEELSRAKRQRDELQAQLASPTNEGIER